MADTFFDRLSAAVSTRGPLCVGLDPSAALLSSWGLGDDAAGVERLARTTIAAVSSVAGIVKFQVAFYERHGSAGYVALERAIADARAAGLVVIADAKRGDIGSTNEAYADAWLRDDSPLAVDAMTVTCYLGVAALAPMFTLAHRTGRGVFTVVASSNPEGRSLQTATTSVGSEVEAAVLAELAATNGAMDRDGPTTRCLGAVVGAPRRPEGLSSFEGPVLVPGMGAQGSDEQEVATLRSSMCHDAVAVNVSRGVLSAGPSTSALTSTAERLAASLR